MFTEVDILRYIVQGMIAGTLYSAMMLWLLKDRITVYVTPIVFFAIYIALKFVIIGF